MDSAPLLERMTEQVSKQCEDIRTATKAEVDRIANDAKNQGDAMRDQSMSSLESELNAAATRMRERAESEAHMLTLTAKDTIADELLISVRSALREAARSDAFPEYLKALLQELFEETKTRLREEGAEEDLTRLTVLSPPGQEERCKEWLKEHGYGNLTVEVATDLEDGVAVQDAQPTFRITNTLSARLTKREDDMRRLCLDNLAANAPQ
jgi:vacuolar-type H+-ATPase subunit E/Vma4